ncbi:RNaseH domain-containing protein [Nostoc sp. DedQUE07]|uniref:RNaseH domain-containing protein n=1 Tax=Nostoc sp. DedQUE07 TaxID=3075392 RepID=UPI002AD55A17|nr:RNaseH domain-containing protein [Nostoc sp. DedQUE07]MDZ8129434.1 RNaseH domain-containing protein [Nostoc sp. DedQUE07]
MTSKITPANILLPARMSLVTDAFANLEIAVLPFPFVQVVADFCHDIKQVLYRGNNREVRWPYRQLNNALLACASTLTYGFEFHSFDEESQLSLYQALAVGTPENSLKTPTPQQIHQLVIIWAQEWTNQYRDKGKKDEVNSVCDRFLERIAVIPPDWQWQPIKPETLVRDINTERGLGFQAIPSLLATMLHGKKCIINSGKTEQEIQWRKVQGGGSSKVGLYVVSKPFKANYTDNNGKEREGYFAYRLDFNVQTQAGRFNNNSNLEPWIFLHLSCQRYPHEPLLDGNYGRDISVLMGMNKARLSDYEVDSTLVCLVIDKNKQEENLWKLQLPELLAAFKARALEQPENIFNNPPAFGNLDNLNNWGERDEYYIVHAEGYGYEHEKRKRGHSIKTGFSFLERGDIIARVLEQINDVLIPDNPMQSDIPTPSGQKAPLAMRDYEFISRPRKGRELYQQIVADTIYRALQGKPMHIFLIYREQDTCETVYQQLRDVFLLNENEDFPAHITVSKILIDNAKLLEKFNTDGLKPKDGSQFDRRMRNEHQAKRDLWRTFLQQRAIPLRNFETNPHCLAIIEIGRIKTKGVLPQQNIKGAIREACIREGISSQMIQTVTPKSSDTENGQNKLPSYSKPTKGRVMNAVLDGTLRQIGALYGLPSKVYEQAKITKEIAQDLDVIAFYRHKTSQFQGDIHYALAVRLRATGAVDVLLPDANDWIPYTQAGIAVGKIFAEARRDRQENKKRLQSKIKLNGTELVQFVARVLTKHLDRATIVLIEAEGWRNGRGEDNDGKIWPQLQNENLLAKRNVLDFCHVPGNSCEYKRDNKQLQNLLSVIRIRTGKETPQYITNREAWNEDCPTRDFQHLSGFYDKSAPELLHYFSVGRLPKTQKAQDEMPIPEFYKLGFQEDKYGANIPFKHQQMVEIVPFFVRSDFQTEEALKALCRVPHYLRCSPAWSMGNIILPYPMHLAQEIIEDHLCILGVNL